jgi:ABC-2 type transport system permease protein
VIHPSVERVAAVLLRHLYLLRGSPARVVPLFAWVAVDMVLWGFLTRYLNRVATAGFDFVPLLLGAVLLWDFFTRVMQGVSMAFFEDVWSRNFLNLFASPLSVPEYVLGLVISSVVTSLVGLAAMLGLATGVFGLSFLGYGVLLLPFLMTLFAFGIALGIVAIALVLRLGPAAEWLIWPIPALLAPFAGVFYPVSTLPAWMRAVSRALPPSYVFEGMRAVLAGGTVRLADLAWGGGLAVAYLALAGWTFARVHRHAVRTGLIGRYSAETAS